MPEYDLICQNPTCQKDFIATKSDKKYCSNACRMAHSRARKKEQQEIEAARAKYEAPILAEIKKLEKRRAGKEKS